MGVCDNMSSFTSNLCHSYQKFDELKGPNQYGVAQGKSTHDPIKTLAQLFHSIKTNESFFPLRTNPSIFDFPIIFCFLDIEAAFPSLLHSSFEPLKDHFGNYDFHLMMKLQKGRGYIGPSSNNPKCFGLNRGVR